jgi:FKBP-type peptidyl-prolyl cis-trans isomerase
MNTIKLTILGFALLSFAACQSKSSDEFAGYEQTESGLYYKFHKKTNREKILMDDFLYGQYWQYWCDSLISQSDTNSRIGLVEEALFSGDITEGFLMMRVGDSVTFILNADSVVKYWGFRKDPYFHLCDCFKMTVHVTRLAPPQDDIGRFMMERKDSIFNVKMESGTTGEETRLQNYLRKNKITVAPNSDGVYVIVLQRGTGAKVAEGKIAEFDWTGRLIDGTVWDSSDEDIAGDAGVAFPQRFYEPMKIKIGEKQWMLGLDNALIDQTVGSKLRIILPSNMVFGYQGNAFVDEFQSVVLDVDLISVK